MPMILDPNWRRGYYIPYGRDKRTGKGGMAVPGVVQDMLSAVMAPGEVYQNPLLMIDPDTGRTSDYAIQRSADLAGMLTLGGTGGTGAARMAAGKPVVDPNTLNVVPMDFARKTPVAKSMPDMPEFGAAVNNTPGARLVDDGLAINVSRHQVPDQSGAQSVRGGVFYLPEGDKNARHYKGSNHYGGTMNVSGETLYKKPLFVKGATGGKAPEAALDQIAGKGAYQKMREDALAAIRVSDRQAKRAAVRAFLEKHAPEITGSEDNIIFNSTKGNQLPLALQEAAVSSAARRAGYDGIIGYSKKKTGEPFISEIFDIRENAYPDDTGYFSVFDQYDN